MKRLLGLSLLLGAANAESQPEQSAPACLVTPTPAADTVIYTKVDAKPFAREMSWSTLATVEVPAGWPTGRQNAARQSCEVRWVVETTGLVNPRTVQMRGGADPNCGLALEPARRAVQTARFCPATKEGRPVRAWYTSRFYLTLRRP
jgi:hypothetical protein